MMMIEHSKDEQIAYLSAAVNLRADQLESAWAEIAYLRNVLAYYASSRNWNTGYIHRDNGLCANRALRVSCD
jgi:hypothetical protein